MKKFEILEHKADLKIRAFGKDKEELFLNMMLGMESALRAKIQSTKPKTRSMKVKSPDIEALLTDFLNEVLYQSQINREIYDGVKFNKFSETELEARLSGKKAESFGQDIKAATHNELEIGKIPDAGWQSTVLFDV